MTPMFLGTIEIGIVLILDLQVVQLARDAGHMYARGADFSQPGNKTILTALGADVGLTTTSSSNAVVYLSQVIFVDDGICQADGKWDKDTNTASGCTNHNKWVFANRIVIGNSSLQASGFGQPTTSQGDPLVLDSGGNVSLDDQVTNAGDVATFAGINPYKNVNNTVTGLPSGQKIYVAEAAAKGISMPPFSNSPIMYSYDMF
jgi:hypothetical protein